VGAGTGGAGSNGAASRATTIRDAVERAQRQLLEEGRPT
jgi:hypothetical protein